MTYEDAIGKLADGCSRLADNVQTLQIAVHDLKQDQEQLRLTVRDLQWKVKELQSVNQILEHKIGSVERVISTHFPSEELLNELAKEVNEL